MALRHGEATVHRTTVVRTDGRRAVDDRKPGATLAPGCPKCGGAMVVRVPWGAPAGVTFLGCSRYPRCTGKANSI
jgi:hypothetical protein